uniref:Phosphatidylinositol-specific phospholipase C X domain-containing protein n=1 Tax=viral metagenome TaxID=1070528 RepID=A0A6C0HHF0_9ZZZZ
MKLLKERATILKENTSVKEGMSVKDEIRSLIGISSGLSIENMNTKRLGLPLREYCIKASYNSAYSGSVINNDMIKYVLSRGCRFLDLQIHYSEKDGIAYVANVTDPKIKEMDSFNRVPLNDMFNVIAANAFMGSQGNDGCPNPKDPLFIHLRIIPDKNAKVYASVAECIVKNFPDKSRFLSKSGKAKRIDKYTQINDKILKKTVFLIDKTYNPEYAYFSQRLTTLLNGETGGSTFQMQDYDRIKNKVKTPPLVKDDFRTTNIIDEQIVIPDISENQPKPSIITMIVNYGVQITLYSFYKSDDKLAQYEDLFNNYKSAIIPMAYAINYLGKMKTELETKKIKFSTFA